MTLRADRATTGPELEQQPRANWPVSVPPHNTSADHARERLEALLVERDSALAERGDQLLRKRPRRQRKPTLASVAKQASKASIPVARYEVRPDGTVVVVTGTPEPSTDSNPWLDNLKVTEQ